MFVVCSLSANGNEVLDKSPKDTVLKFSPAGSNSWFPYYIDGIKRKGIIPEIMALIFEHAEIKGEQVTLPPARTNLSLLNGDIDIDFINPDWLPEREKSDQFTFSIPILPIKESYIALNTEDLEQLNQLMNGASKLRIGTVRGYYYHDDDQFQRVDYKSEKHFILALSYKRIRYAICDDITARYWSKELSVPIEIGQIHSDGFLRLRIRSEHKKVLPQINAAIKHLKESGTVDKIIRSYID